VSDEAGALMEPLSVAIWACRMARANGANGAELAGFEADALIECSGHPVALRDGIGVLRPAGTAVIVGMGLVASGRVDPESIITGRFGLEQAETALRAGREDPASVKAMIEPAR
jgi:L-iditol 2-dehydrogenase